MEAASLHSIPIQKITGQPIIYLKDSVYLEANAQDPSPITQAMAPNEGKVEAGTRKAKKSIPLKRNKTFTTLRDFTEF